MNSVATGAKIGMGAVGIETARYAKKYFELRNYQLELASLDRDHLLNGLPMAGVPEPPRPQLRKSRGWSHAWWIAGLSTLLLFVAGGFVAGFFAGTLGGESVPRSLVLSGMFGAFAAVPGAVLAFIVAMILLAVGIAVKRGHKVEHDVAEQKYQGWEAREDARLALWNGQVPIAYLDKIGFDPRSIRAQKHGL